MSRLPERLQRPTISFDPVEAQQSDLHIVVSVYDEGDVLVGCQWISENDLHELIEEAYLTAGRVACHSSGHQRPPFWHDRPGEVTECYRCSAEIVIEEDGTIVPVIPAPDGSEP